MKQGIDVSLFQGVFDFAKAKKDFGVEFAIIRAGQGNYIDDKFEANYESCKREGIPCGAYIVLTGKTVYAAKAEADYFIDHCLDGKQFELPIYCDIELQDLLALGKKNLTACIRAFCGRLLERGWFAGVYGSAAMFPDFTNDEELAEYPHWIACYAQQCGYPKSQLHMWQYSCTDIICGVACDRNRLYIDYSEKIKAEGYNGWKTSAPAPDKNPSAENSEKEDESGAGGKDSPSDQEPDKNIDAGVFSAAWWKAAAIRAGKTVVQTFAAAVGTGMAAGQWDWKTITAAAFTAIGAGILSLFTSIGGLPEVK